METSNLLGRKENPILKSETFLGAASTEYNNAMTVQGAVNKTGILLALVALSAAASWLSVPLFGDTGLQYFLVMLASFAAFVVGWITSVNMRFSPFTAPAYAILEGSVLGTLSSFFGARYPGVVIQAVFLTFGTLFGILVIYRASGFKVTAKFRAGLLSALFAILLVYLLELLLSMLGLQASSLTDKSLLVGIVFSFFTVVIAALNLVLDFDIIETGAREGAPKYMEWYAAFGLMVTLIWLYLEILELLIRLYLASDDDS